MGNGSAPMVHHGIVVAIVFFIMFFSLAFACRSCADAEDDVDRMKGQLRQAQAMYCPERQAVTTLCEGRSEE